MTSRVLQAIRDARLPGRGAAVVVGVSGGADSVALLHALLPVARARAWRLIVAHFNHGIRGRAADRDTAFVQALAARRGLECRVGRADVPALARARGISVEMAAREVRRRFLAETARSCHAAAVVLAHHADDQAETLLLRLARGTGRGGLGGMAGESLLHEASDVPVLRPLLACLRKDIEAFLRRHRIAWREDASNRDLAHLRNRVRRRVLPVLERELNPAVRDALARTADVLRAEDEYLDGEALRALRRCRRPGGALDGARLARAHPAVRRRAIRLWLMAAGVGAPALDFDLVERIDRLLGCRAGTRWTPVSEAMRVASVYGVLRVIRMSEPCLAPPTPLELPIPGRVVDAARGLAIECRMARGFARRREAGPGVYPATAWLSAARIAGHALKIRSLRSGDRIRPLGMASAAKIQDILVNARVPRDRRRGMPVVECDGEIVWLPGYRVAEGWQVPGTRARSVRISMMRTALTPCPGGAGRASSAG